MGLKFATNNIIVDVLLDFIFQKGVKKVFNILFTRVTSLYKKWGVVAVQISWFRQSIAQAESFPVSKLHRRSRYKPFEGCLGRTNIPILRQRSQEGNDVGEREKFI